MQVTHHECIENSSVGNKAVNEYVWLLSELILSHWLQVLAENNNMHDDFKKIVSMRLNLHINSMLYIYIYIYIYIYYCEEIDMVTRRSVEHWTRALTAFGKVN